MKRISAFRASRMNGSDSMDELLQDLTRLCLGPISARWVNLYLTRLMKTCTHSWSRRSSKRRKGQITKKFTNLKLIRNSKKTSKSSAISLRRARWPRSLRCAKLAEKILKTSLSTACLGSKLTIITKSIHMQNRSSLERWQQSSSTRPLELVWKKVPTWSRRQACSLQRQVR